MKYAQSYKDWKTKFSSKSVVRRGKQAASIFAIMAIVVPFLFPVGAVAQTVEDPTLDVPDAVELAIPVVDETPEATEEEAATGEEEIQEPVNREISPLESELDLVPKDEVVSPPAVIYAHKVVCADEMYLPNWGGTGVQAGEPAMISEDTAADFVAASDGNCHLQTDWTFQYGFAEKDGTSGVHKLPGDHLGTADGTPTTGQCPPRYCGPNTFTGTDYNDWKNFDSSTSSGGVTPAKVEIYDIEGAPGVWVRENLQSGYLAYSYPPDEVPGSNVSAEMYCHVDINNFDNYDEAQGVVLGEEYYCISFNALEGPQIEAYKIVCLNESDLPNWGEAGFQPDEPAMITASTATDFVANSNQQCELQEDWSFQYGFSEKDGTSGVHKLPGGQLGQADGTATTGECPPRYCGTNTFTGTDYNDWKNFDTSTSSNGVVTAKVTISDLEGAPGVWVREQLQDGYVPFSYPPDEVPGSNVSAEIYCHVDINNYDNYDEVQSPVNGETYYCVAFNALEDELGSISGSVFFDSDQDGVWDDGEAELSGWTAYIDANSNDVKDGDELSDETSSPYLIDNLGNGTYTVRVVLQDGYTQTYPLLPDEHTVEITAHEDEMDWNFGVYSQDTGGGGNGNRSSRSSSGGRVLDSSTDAEPELTPQVAGESFDVPEGRTLPRTGVQIVWLMLAGVAASAVVRKQSV